jgi:outer membrane lipoprotein SlyB
MRTRTKAYREVPDPIGLELGEMPVQEVATLATDKTVAEKVEIVVGAVAGGLLGGIIGTVKGLGKGVGKAAKKELGPTFKPLGTLFVEKIYDPIKKSVDECVEAETKKEETKSE